MAKQTENNVGIYLRLSKEDMLEGESLSIENQKMILTKFVHDKGWNLVSEYVDQAYRNCLLTLSSERSISWL